jgi:transposase
MKKLTRKAVRFKGLTLGLDLHKKFIEWCLLDGDGEETDAGRIAGTPEALAKLLGRWQGQRLQVGMEACGSFIWVYDLAKAQLGAEAVHVAQPSKLRVIGDSMEKTDAHDAWWLAYILHEGRLPEAFVVEGTLRDLRIATRELRSYTDLRSDLLRRFKSHLAQAGVTIAKSWQASKRGRAAAKEAVGRVEGERGKALERLRRMIAQLSRMLHFWQARIRDLSPHFPKIAVLRQELPGVGETIAPIIVAELNDPQAFHSEKAYAKATGLIPGERETGGKKQAVGITRAGSRHARWAFTRAIVCCLRSKQGVGLQIRQWVELRARYKPKRKVIVAAARKLAEGVWRLFAWGEAFNLARAFPVKTSSA